MKLIIEMPQVTKCAASDCAYNAKHACHARAITMGDADGHRCDTMMALPSHCRRAEIAGVGACRAVDCKFNVDLECEAPAVAVSVAGGIAECKTYARA